MSLFYMQKKKKNILQTSFCTHTAEFAFGVKISVNGEFRVCWWLLVFCVVVKLNCGDELCSVAVGVIDESDGLCDDAPFLVHRGGGAGGIRSGIKFNVLGGVGRTPRTFPLVLSLNVLFVFVLLLLQLLPLVALLLLLFESAPLLVNIDNFSRSNDFRFWVLNVLNEHPLLLVLVPTIPVCPLSTGDMVNIKLSIDSGLSICWPVLVKLLRLDAVSDGVPGLKTFPLTTVCWLLVTIFCWWPLNIVVPRPLDSVFDADDAGTGLVFADGRGFAIG